VDVTYACVCCGYLTLSEPPGSHEICPLCGWEDDVYQLRWPYRPGGANKSSLIAAQKRLATSGFGRERDQARTADVADFDRVPFWRPIDVGRDRFEPRGGPLAPWPEDRTVLYWWRRRIGTAWWENVAPAVLQCDEPDGVPDAAFIDAVRAVSDSPAATSAPPPGASPR
jgi:hypothetical protein